MAVTIRDLAERLNLSKSTVSYALNGGPKPVSEDVRRRVEDAAREMGYRPNEIARSLAVGRTHTIGFVPSSVRQRTLRSWFERTALEAICVAADEGGLHLLLPSATSPGGGTGIRDPHFATRVDGVVLLAPPETSVLSTYLHSRSIPMATIAGKDARFGPCFNADNVAGTNAVVDHLVQLGHRRIAIVTHQDHVDTAQRHQAFLDRMLSLGLPVPDELVETTDLLPEGGYLAARRLLSRKDRPTAVFCVNDPTGAGFIRGAQELGLSVPNDLSVVGFDDDEIGATFMPSLTTVRQPVAEMAVAAFDAVVDQIAGHSPGSRTFPTPLIVRASTRPPEDRSRHG
jgi:LacI family transcriptional regulator